MAPADGGDARVRAGEALPPLLLSLLLALVSLSLELLLLLRACRCVTRVAPRVRGASPLAASARVVAGGRRASPVLARRAGRRSGGTAAEVSTRARRAPACVGAGAAAAVVGVGGDGAAGALSDGRDDVGAVRRSSESTG